jgi:hypothetical protein
MEGASDLFFRTCIMKPYELIFALAVVVAVVTVIALAFGGRIN